MLSLTGWNLTFWLLGNDVSFWDLPKIDESWWYLLISDVMGRLVSKFVSDRTVQVTCVCRVHYQVYLGVGGHRGVNQEQLAYGHSHVDVEVYLTSCGSTFDWGLIFRVSEASRTYVERWFQVAEDNGYVVLAGPGILCPFLTLLDDPKSTNPDGITLRDPNRWISNGDLEVINWTVLNLY